MLMDSIRSMRFNVATKRADQMKTLLLAILLLASPAWTQSVWAQTKLTPKGSAAHVDNCAPIGRTANGELVYSMKCDNIPAPPPPQQAEVKQAAPPPPAEPETERTGLFGMSFDRRPKDQ
jgi:hypothetical protein